MLLADILSPQCERTKEIVSNGWTGLMPPRRPRLRAPNREYRDIAMLL